MTEKPPAPKTIRPRVLCVDDEPKVLEGLALTLRRKFDVTTAPGGEQGLTALEQGDPFAVVLSDMRMPGMDGAHFLEKVCEKAPDTVRMLLTGHTDLDSAIAAVNKGRIFRFLTKPCPREDLLDAMGAAAEQHRLITAERVLLEETLSGALKVFSDILSLLNPAAFGRASRIQRLVRQMIPYLGRESAWQLDLSSMLSQIGLVTVPEDIVEKFAGNKRLTSDEQETWDQYPRTGADLIRNIPRLEEIAENVAEQNRRFTSRLASVRLPLGARVLKVVSDYDWLATAGSSGEDALNQMEERTGWYDPEIFAILGKIVRAENHQKQIREVLARDLELGMVVHSEVKSADGMVLVGKGQEITPTLLVRLKSFARFSNIQEPLHVVAGAPTRSRERQSAEQAILSA